MKQTERIERMAKETVRTMAIAGFIAILLFAVPASAETARQKVVKEACYALDGSVDYSCGETIKIGNWDCVFALRFRINKNNPREAVFFVVFSVCDVYSINLKLWTIWSKIDLSSGYDTDSR